ncbi:hypothetical protein PHYBLDRAFT_138658 [Phycomyces blakesleeanus NRRL 1555(-)]|uniref:Reverse transcriptase/retrotransposon-derived protein RNase H-like domain-containing protein n=1 Tax=Phycomyces blakesleeanus (strain ATCC 8743b / DSM 1359 / FGSC 10004 / NBRC 33097 / NRRL 1555) TaxID=763407 RepID=A0A163ERQ5_PHYB8|nr:hypothetical protein PHYBLDRAFT_138658 [Phycomyces blakesleeanus NRRL 1555(-)]OAD81110.1 hypothetical protein PHYBLDRAFT_138658 [Phycomyces blakesleeanus NRRL 1555(-)]|eukprot:XP_018299150.1 hypothetical protein PHYBLDRAFT_138658 [Phycomyces blakesleeanus NRRL 1555(-)]
MAWPTPKTCRDIQSFLAHATALLDALQSANNIEHIWNDKHQRCFEQLKAIIQSNPVLQHPDLTQLFLVATNAFKLGIQP